MTAQEQDLLLNDVTGITLGGTGADGVTMVAQYSDGTERLALQRRTPVQSAKTKTAAPPESPADAAAARLLIGVVLSSRAHRALQRVIGRLAIGERSTLFLDLLVQRLYLIVGYWVGTGFEELVDPRP